MFESWWEDEDCDC